MNTVEDNLNEVMKVQQEKFLKHLNPVMGEEGKILINFNSGSLNYAKPDGGLEQTPVGFMFVSHPSLEKIYSFSLEDFDYIVDGIKNEDYSFLTRPNKNKGFLENDQPMVFNEFPFEMPEVWLDFGHNKATDKEKAIYKFLTEALSTKVFDLVSKAIVISKELADLVKVKDHDLYLVFKADNEFKYLNLSLEKVSFRLPDDTELSLGDVGLNPEDWKVHGERAFVVAKRIRTCMNTINREIDDSIKNLSKSGLREAFVFWFDQHLKDTLMATSHYLTEVYNFKLKDGEEYVEEVVNEILGKLNDHGGSIGLDLNSWITWDYSDPSKEPVRVESINILELLHGKYTESFVQAVYDKMINIRSEYLKPYFHKEVVNEDDGVKIGEIRRVH